MNLEAFGHLPRDPGPVARRAEKTVENHQRRTRARDLRVQRDRQGLDSVRLGDRGSPRRIEVSPISVGERATLPRP